MSCNKKETALIYADLNNLFHRVKKIEFKKLLEYINKEVDIIRATAFISTDKNSDTQNKFLTYLSNSNWRVNQIDISINTNIDNMINVDATNEARDFQPDWVYIIGCDGDFSYLLDDLRRKGIKIAILGIKEFTSLNLRMVADKVEYLNNIEGIILDKEK